MPPSNNPRSLRYVLITAAYNEEAYIEKTILSVISQTLPPKRWVVVSDGSTDRTDEIVLGHAEKHPFIELLRLEKDHKRNFAAQVHAINAGYDRIKNLDFDFVGNLDSDVSLGADYFARLLETVASDPAWGIAGGFIYEEDRKTGQFRSRKMNTERSVAHATQLFRRECFEAIGGYKALRYGGPDWYAEINARMNGWRVESVPDLPVYHHRPTGGGTGMLRYCYQQGLMDYSLGVDPFFQLVKCIRRLPFGPVGALTRLAAFAGACCRRDERLASEEFVRFLRNEQRTLLRSWLRGESLDYLGTRSNASQRIKQRVTR